MIFVKYHVSSGGIICKYVAPPEMAPAYCEDGEMFFELEPDSNINDSSHYIKNGELKEKSSINYNVSYSGNNAIISGVPQGCTARIEGHKFETDGEDISVKFDSAGTYIMMIQSIEYLDTTVRIEIDG